MFHDVCMVCGKKSRLSKKKQRKIVLEWLDEQVRELDRRRRMQFVWLLLLDKRWESSFLLYLCSRFVLDERIEKDDPVMGSFLEQAALEHFEHVDPHGLATVIESRAPRKRAATRS